MDTLTDTPTQTHTQASRHRGNCVHTHHTSWSYLNLATHTHTHALRKTNNCPDGILLCDLRSVVWGSLLLNPLNALGIPPSLYRSFAPPLLQSCFLAEWTLIIGQINSGPRQSWLYLWEPCLLPVNALLFTDVLYSAFAGSGSDETAVSWRHFLLRKPLTQTHRSIVPYLAYFHVWCGWARRQSESPFFHNGLKGIKATCI